VRGSVWILPARSLTLSFLSLYIFLFVEALVAIVMRLLMPAKGLGDVPFLGLGLY
jgi:hypothetical protein